MNNQQQFYQQPKIQTTYTPQYKSPRLKQKPPKQKMSFKTKIILATVSVLILIVLVPAEETSVSETTSTTQTTTTEKQAPNTIITTTEKEIDENIKLLMNATQYDEKVCEKIFGQLRECGYTSIGNLTEVSTGVSTKSFKVTGEYFGSGMIIVNKEGLYFFSWGNDTIYDSEKPSVVKNINDYAIGNLDSTKYFSAAEKAITGLLKSPSTAEFPSQVWSDGWGISISDGIVTVSSYVDAQNSFGSMIRSYFTVQYRNSDGKGVYLEFDGDIYLDER